MRPFKYGLEIGSLADVFFHGWVSTYYSLGGGGLAVVDDELTDVPTVELKRAIQAVQPIHENHLALLRSHARAAGHTLTATQLAEAVGYQNYGAVNLQYGTFADRLCST